MNDTDADDLISMVDAHVKLMDARGITPPSDQSAWLTLKLLLVVADRLVELTRKDKSLTEGTATPEDWMP